MNFRLDKMASVTKTAILFLVIISAASGGNMKKIYRDREGKIVGGEVIDIEDAPHQVSITLKGSGHHCGGSIISERLILTAAHCITGLDPTETMQIRIGSSYTNSGGVLFDIETGRHHENFSYDTMDYDIALLKLKEPLMPGPKSKPIKIVDKNSVPKQGVEAVVTGWGKIGEMEPTSNVLRKVVVPLVKHEDCAAAYENFQPLTERMFCAGLQKGGKDACQGDSGGPLTIKGKLGGIVSWGKGCARPFYPGVYTDVSLFIEWIENTSKELDKM